MTPIDVGLSFATSSAADSGHTGAFYVTGGGEGGLVSSLLPKVPPNQAWVVWLVVGAVAGLGVFLYFRRK